MERKRLKWELCRGLNYLKESVETVEARLITPIWIILFTENLGNFKSKKVVSYSYYEKKKVEMRIKLRQRERGDSGGKANNSNMNYFIHRKFWKF